MCLVLPEHYYRKVKMTESGVVDQYAVSPLCGFDIASASSLSRPCGKARVILEGHHLSSHGTVLYRIKL